MPTILFCNLLLQKNKYWGNYEKVVLVLQPQYFCHYLYNQEQYSSLLQGGTGKLLKTIVKITKAGGKTTKRCCQKQCGSEGCCPFSETAIPQSKFR